MRNLLFLALGALLSGSAFGAGANLLAEAQGTLASISHELTPTNSKRLSSAIAREYQEFDPLKYDSDALVDQAPATIDTLGQIQLALHKKLQDLYYGSELTEVRANAIRSAINQVRAVRDYLGYLTLRNDAEGLPFKPMQRPHVLNGLEAPNFEFQSGDILLSRGDAATSAAIARMGDTPNPFSHVAVVYVDPKTKLAYTVEAHIEVGSVVAPIAKYSTDGKVRSMVLRYRDPEATHRGAEFMYNVVKDASQHGQNIPYDFTLDDNAINRSNCCNVARHGAAELGYNVDYLEFRRANRGPFVATEQKFQIPLIRSRISMRNRQFLQRLAIDDKTTVATLPGDFQIDPRADIVAEWTDFGRIHNSLVRDAIWDSFYRWMDSKARYAFKDSSFTRVASELLYRARRLPLCDALLSTTFPLNMTQKALETTFLLEKASARIMNKVMAEDAAYRAKTGFPLPPKKMGGVIERIRAADLEATKPEFSKIFGPTATEAFSSPRS